MDATGIGSQQLFTYSSAKLCRSTKNMCGKTAPWRSNIGPETQNTSLITETDKGDKSIIGQHKYFYNADSLLLPDGTINTDPIQIHDLLTEASTKHFIYHPTTQTISALI